MAEEDIQETTPNPEGGEATAVAEPYSIRFLRNG